MKTKSPSEAQENKKKDNTHLYPIESEVNEVSDDRKLYILYIIVSALDPMDIQSFNDLLFKNKEKTITSAEKKAMTFYLQKAEKAVKQYKPEQQREIRFRMRGFVSE